MIHALAYPLCVVNKSAEKWNCVTGLHGRGSHSTDIESGQKWQIINNNTTFAILVAAIVHYEGVCVFCLVDEKDSGTKAVYPLLLVTLSFDDPR